MRGTLVIASMAVMLTAGLARAAGPQIPPDKRNLRIEYIPGKLGAVFFAHAEHVKKGDGSTKQSLECFACHHDRKFKPTRTAEEIQSCRECHVGILEKPIMVEGKLSPPFATLKPNGAIEQSSVLYHAYCRDWCHKSVGRRVRGLTTCRACHERGISGASIGLRYDEVEDSHAGTSWLSCPVGQRFTVEGCAEAARKVTWNAAQNACPEGFVLPSSSHFQEVLGRCDSSLRKGQEGSCRPCPEGKRCSSLFPLIRELLWTSTVDLESPSAVWTANLSTGRLSLSRKSEEAAVLCIRDSFPSKRAGDVQTTERRVGRCDIYNATDSTFIVKSGSVIGQKISPHLTSSIAAGVITGKNDDGDPLGGSCTDGDSVGIVERDGVFLILPR